MIVVISRQNETDRHQIVLDLADIIRHFQRHSYSRSKMRFSKIVLTCLIVFLSTTMAFNEEPSDSFPPSLDDFARGQIDSALLFSGITKTDAGFEKKWVSDTLFRLPLVELFLDKPLQLPDTIDAWTKLAIESRADLPKLVDWAFASIDEKIPPREYRGLADKIERIAKKDTTGTNVEEPYRAALRLVLASFDVASQHRTKMMEDVSTESLDSLLQLLPEFWTDSEDDASDSLEYYLMKLLGHEYDTTWDIPLDSLYETIHALDLSELGLATAAVSIGLEKAIELIRDDSTSALLDPVVVETRWGTAIIGSEGEDLFENAAIVLDPGGNDHYKGDIAVGVIGKADFGVVIDAGGDDYYDSRNCVFGQASGVFGVGAIVDLSGDDIYITGLYGQGAGLFGSGILVDYEGDDLYQGGTYVQGAGTFGVGILIDLAGEDGYRSHVHSQAFAGPKGFGFLADHSGCDQYFCGGKYSHDPLAPFDYHSFAQGFSLGLRPDVSGGIGFLFDKGGNDTYTSGVYAQGVSYWYSLALLVDNEGNDVYTSVWYPQGSGIHLSVGSLVDRGGNDIYVSPQGPGQGAAHDYSVGFFSEYRGNDIYVIDGGNGVALTNSFALFVDRNGNDTYCKRFDRTKNWGYARGARGTGNIGLFLELQGDDLYNDIEYADNNEYWLPGEIAFGMDIESEPFPDPVKELSEEKADEEPDTTERTIETIFNEACGWAVGSGQDKAKKAFEELLDSGQVAADYICEKQLGTKSSLRTRTIKNFCVKKPELMMPCLFAALHEDDIERRGNSIYLLGEIGDTAAVDSLIPLLAIKRTRIGAISALGKIGDERAVPPIMKYRKDDRQPVRYMVSKALADFKDPRGIPAMIDFLNDDYITVRLASQFGLANMFEEAFDTVVYLIPKARSPKRLHLMRVLSSMVAKMAKADDFDPILLELRKAEARAALLPLVTGDNPVDRAHAVKALARIGGEETIAELRRLYELEPHPFVRAMFRKGIKE